MGDLLRLNLLYLPEVILLEVLPFPLVGVVVPPLASLGGASTFAGVACQYRHRAELYRCSACRLRARSGKSRECDSRRSDADPRGRKELLRPRGRFGECGEGWRWHLRRTYPGSNSPDRERERRNAVVSFGKSEKSEEIRE